MFVSCIALLHVVVVEAENVTKMSIIVKEETKGWKDTYIHRRMSMSMFPPKGRGHHTLFFSSK